MKRNLVGLEGADVHIISVLQSLTSARIHMILLCFLTLENSSWSYDIKDIRLAFFLRQWKLMVDCASRN